MQKIKLNDGRVIVLNPDLMTVGKRKEIRNKYNGSKVEVVEDKEILAKAVEKFSANAPTQMEIYEVATSLLKKQEPVDNTEAIFEEMCAACCQWENARPLDLEEWQKLPFDAADFISDKLFTESDKSFLVV